MQAAECTEHLGTQHIVKVNHTVKPEPVAMFLEQTP